MESFQNWVPLFLNDTKSNFLGIPNSLRVEGGAVEVSAALPTRPPRYLLFIFNQLDFVNSSRFSATVFRPSGLLTLFFFFSNCSQLWTSLKLCAICFVAGIVVGYTRKPRVRGWAFGFLKRLKDD